MRQAVKLIKQARSMAECWLSSVAQSEGIS
jgi:hypothetical protein